METRHLGAAPGPYMCILPSSSLCPLLRPVQPWRAPAQGAPVTSRPLHGSLLEAGPEQHPPSPSSPRLFFQQACSLNSRLSCFLPECSELAASVETTSAGDRRTRSWAKPIKTGDSLSPSLAPQLASLIKIFFKERVCNVTVN